MAGFVSEKVVQKNTPTQKDHVQKSKQWSSSLLVHGKTVTSDDGKKTSNHEMNRTNYTGVLPEKASTKSYRHDVAGYLNR